MLLFDKIHHIDNEIILNYNVNEGKYMNNNKKETFTKIKQIYSELLNKINLNMLDKKI